MASRNRWPSRWWFWGPVIGANLDLLAVYPFFWGRAGPPSLVSWMLVLPFWLYVKFVGVHITDALGLEAYTEPVTTYAVVLALWELLAVVLGLACYGVVLLLYAIVPGRPDSGDRERGQLGR